MFEFKNKNEHIQQFIDYLSSDDEYLNSLDDYEKAEIDEIIYKYCAIAIAQVQRTLYIREPYLNSDFNITLEKIFRFILTGMYGFLETDVKFHQQKNIFLKLVRASMANFYKFINEKQSYPDREEFLYTIAEKLNELLKSNLEDIGYSVDSEIFTKDFVTRGGKKIEILSEYSLSNVCSNFQEKCIPLFEKIKSFNTPVSKFVYVFIGCSCALLAVYHGKSIHVEIISLLVLLLSMLFFAFSFLCNFRIKRINTKIDNIVATNNNPKLVGVLGVDVLKLTMSDNLIIFFNPDAENQGLLAIADARMNLVELSGVILPNIRMLDDSNLNDNEIEFYVRDKKVCKYSFFSDRYAVEVEYFVQNNIELPDNAVYFKTLFNQGFHWVDEKFIKKYNISEFCTPTKILSVLIAGIAIIYADEVLGADNLFMQEFVNNNALNGVLNFAEIKHILVYIIQNGGSIKDVEFISEKILLHIRESKDLNYIAHLVLKDLNQISGK